MMWPLVLGIVLAACSGSPPRRLDAAATRRLEITGDVVVRREADGVVSVMAAATLDGVTAFGVVLLPAASDARRSPHAIVARARAWHALSLIFDGSPQRAVDAATRGVQMLPSCERAALGTTASSIRDILRARLRCYTRQHHLTSSDEVIIIDSARRAILRRESERDVGVISVVELDGTVAAGYARVRGVAVAEVAGSAYATLARGRAWQLAARLTMSDPERSYTAARQGLHEMSCKVDRWRSAIATADVQHEDGATEAARDLLRRVLDDTLEHCVRTYEYRTRTWKVKGRQAL